MGVNGTELKGSSDDQKLMFFPENLKIHQFLRGWASLLNDDHNLYRKVDKTGIWVSPKLWGSNNLQILEIVWVFPEFVCFKFNLSVYNYYYRIEYQFKWNTNYSFDWNMTLFWNIHRCNQQKRPCCCSQNDLGGYQVIADINEVVDFVVNDVVDVIATGI